MTSPTNPSEPNAAQVPMTEEFDSFKHTMPNFLPVVIAMMLVAAVLGFLAYILRSTPVVAGSIDEAFAVTIPNQNSSLAVVNLTFQNLTKKSLWLENINVAVHTKDSDFKDDFGSVADFPRFFQASPALKQHAQTGLVRDTKIAPMEKTSGSVIVSFPLTQEEFDARDSMTVKLTFADQKSVTITTGKKK
ncbi:MAG: hypothetical protein CXZ00_11805 [Acidobacteria bacterium]|mgnify:CR=1 FL=1|nr:MAG: hypothetical protein CXZ00_11805 [Acidobacteriota bacterium]